jgi:hypothetical protein
MRARLLGFHAPLAAAAALAVWLAVEQLPAAPARTHLKALVVTTSAELPRREAVWRQGGPHDAHRYVELLTAANVPFEVMWMERFEIPLRYLVEGDLRKYATIILATPARNLTDRSVEALLLASERHGVSLVAAGDAVDARLRLAFGVRELSPDGDRPVRPLPGSRVEPLGEGGPGRVVHRFGRAVNYYFTASGRGYLDGYGPAQPAVREAIRANSGHGMVSVALPGVAVLRMDDALFNGSSFQQDRRWPGALHVRLDEAAWARVRAVLARHEARMSVGVVTGYVDDGDPARGTLYRHRQAVTDRRCGTVYESREMGYVDRRGPRPGRQYDYESEYRGVLAGVREGVLDAELHGYAHVSPDRAGWCRAPDRETNLEWLMELAPPPGRPTTAEDQRAILEAGSRRIASWFGAPPSTLIPPSHGMNDDTERVARDFGLRLVNGPFLTLLRPDRVVQNSKVRTFWAHWADDGVTGVALEAGYPFTVGLHDRELVRRGADWFDAFLGRWRAAGVTRFVTLRELAAHLGARLSATLAADALSVVVERAGEAAVRLEVALPAGRRLQAVQLDDAPWREYTVAAGRVLVTLPPAGGRARQTLRLDLRPEQAREAADAA